MNTKTKNLNFGGNLRRIRKAKGYTQSDLARMSGISRRMIGHYETLIKRPSVDKIKKIANALSISTDELLGTTESKNNKKDNLSYKLMKKLRVVEELPTRDQNTIFSLINALAEKNKLKKK